MALPPVRHIVHATILQTNDPPHLRIECLVIPQISPPLPSQHVPHDNWLHLFHLKLADPHFYLPLNIDLLLGADVYPLIHRPGQIRSQRRSPTALNTSLGWILLGSYGPPTPTRHVRFHPSVNDNEIQTSIPHVHQLTQSEATINSTKLIVHNHETAPITLLTTSSSEDTIDELSQAISKLWELDKVSNQPLLSPAERQCEDIFISTTTRDTSGRYQVNLPFCDFGLGESYNVALRQFSRLETRLHRQPALKDAYHTFMREYLDNGHMELVSPQERPSHKPYYIPHHPVHRSGDPETKIRVVFNASCRTSSGKSLNDILLTGPKLQSDISALINRFRTHTYVFTADIRQMYRQIQVCHEHQNYQRILWRFSQHEPISSYRLTTVTYGVSSAPYLALRTLQQLASDESHRFPNAARILQSEVYVDDILTGCETVSDALQMRQEITDLLMAGGFELRKWLANSPQLLQGIPEEHLRLPPSSDVFTLDRDPVVKILGLAWCPESDHFTYSVHPSHQACTKRSILSQLARIFDPAGWLGPTVFLAKMFIQQLWLQKLEWDDPPPDKIVQAWTRFQSELPSIANITIPRHIDHIRHQSSTSFMVGFCDASERGYAAVVYLVTTFHNDINITLLASRSRVAPLKKINVPRLELCAAHLLAKLVQSLHTQLSDLPLGPAVAFSDSTIALAWIAGEPHRWKTFVANRVSEIQDIIPSPRWLHVSTDDNPADCASRGLLPKELCTHELWWTGPLWLKEPLHKWPITIAPEVNNSIITAEARDAPSFTLLSPSPSDEFIERFSSLDRLKRVIAYCFRFISNIRNRHTGHPRSHGPLTIDELNNALLWATRRTQTMALPVEREEAQKPNTRHRLVRQLGLFIDPDNILRVGGRLSASGLPYTHRHPALIPKNHPFANLIIDHAHKLNLHAGPLSTHAFIRQSFWIMDGRNAVRIRLAKCNRCFTCKPRPVIQPMADLPLDRCQVSAPFYKVGVDYAGPFSITTGRIRGARVTKAYVCAFVCFTTKAVHLELASDLTTPCFIAAYRRFISRRGNSAMIFSDNGTNFVGAHREFNDLARLLTSDHHQTTIISTASSVGTDWRFIPPSAPHFGGLWEATVKATKHHLRRVMGTQLLTYEEFTTLLTQIEAILNSRPLCPMSADPSDLSVLTPGHFLIQRPLTDPPIADLTFNIGNRLKRWQLLEHARDAFWKRWQVEYLHNLQQRSKWLGPATTISPGTMVLIKSSQAPALSWPLGRISRVFPGPDGVVRVAEVKTSSGTLTRPLVKLCPLPSQ